MRRVILLALLLTVSTAGALKRLDAAQQPSFVTHQQVTLIMKDGQKHNGTLVYHNDNNFNLLVNGQEQPYPVADIALVDFTGGGQPAAQELTQLPTSDDPPELQRHMVVLSDGTAVRGKLYTIKENAITFDTQEGQRRDFDLSNINRLYVSAPGARRLFASQLAQPPSVVATAGSSTGALQVNPAAAWTDTGRVVRRGQRVTFVTTGEIHYGAGGDMVANADGKAGDSEQARLPVPEMGVGGLIGRVGEGKPFRIGVGPVTITMPANGRLSIGVNDGNLGDNTGMFSVTIK